MAEVVIIAPWPNLACAFLALELLVYWKKVSLKVDGSLERNLPNSDDIILMNINFENLVVELYVPIISSILTKFLKN